MGENPYPTEVLARNMAEIGPRQLFLLLAPACLVGSVLLTGCGTAAGAEPKDSASPGIESPNAAALEPAGASGKPEAGAGPDAYLLFNQRWIEGLTVDTVDFEDVDAMFWHVFSGLPDEVVVYPSENYYYFIVYLGGRQFWGNIRLPAGRWDRGVLSFGYFEFKEKWLRKSEQGDKWNRCLIEGMIVLSETGARDEQTTPP